MKELSTLWDTGIRNPVFRSWPELFDRFSAVPMAEDWTGGKWTPRVEVKETADAYVITAEVPGIKSEDIKVTVTEDAVAIAGEKHEEKIEESENQHMSERTYGAFQRTLKFPNALDRKHVDADVNEGVLTVKVKKSEVAQPVQVKVHKR